MIDGFNVIRRNYGHWDICNNKQRLYRIRGGPGKYIVLDDADQSRESFNFNTLAASMSFICDELMYELIIAEGQEPHVIEGWNV